MVFAQQDLAIGQGLLVTGQVFCVVGQLLWAAPEEAHPVNPTVERRATERSVTMVFMLDEILAEKSVYASDKKGFFEVPSP